MKLRHLTISTSALVLMAGCGDATGVRPDDLEGTWTATSFVFTQTAAPNTTVDIVARDMAALTIVFGANATYLFNFILPGQPSEDEAELGLYTVIGSALKLFRSGIGTPKSFTISRDGNTLTLTGTDTFDFTARPAEGVEEAATLVITLKR